MKFNRLAWIFVLCEMPLIASAELIGFHTENYDITCIASVSENNSRIDKQPFVGCAIKSYFITHKYKRDDSCDLDWGGNFSVSSRGNAEIDCMGDTYASAEEQSQLLKPGKVIKGKGWRCQAINNHGIRCINADKKGFLLDRNKQVIF